jgi:hypothetical protein
LRVCNILREAFSHRSAAYEQPSADGQVFTEFSPRNCHLTPSIAVWRGVVDLDHLACALDAKARQNCWKRRAPGLNGGLSKSRVGRIMRKRWEIAKTGHSFQRGKLQVLRCLCLIATGA